MSEFWIESHHSLSKPKNQITNVGVRFWWPVLRIERIQRSQKKPSTAQSKGRWGSEVPPPVAISTKIKKFKSSMTDVPPSPSILKTTSTPRTPRSESNSNSIWNLKSVYEKKKKKNPLGNGDHKEQIPEVTCLTLSSSQRLWWSGEEEISKRSSRTVRFDLDHEIVKPSRFEDEGSGFFYFLFFSNTMCDWIDNFLSKKKLLTHHHFFYFFWFTKFSSICSRSSFTFETKAKESYWQTSERG